MKTKNLGTRILSRARSISGTIARNSGVLAPLYWRLAQRRGSHQLNEELAIAQHLESIRNFRDDQKGAISLERLADILEHAASTVPYYKGLKLKCPRKLADFPVMTKNDYRENLGSFISEIFEIETLDKRNTGGSTGEPFEFYSNKKAGLADNAHHWFLYKLMGHKEGDLIVSGGGIHLPLELRKKNIFWEKRYRGHVFGDYAFSALYVDKSNVRIYVEKLLELQPAILRGYPSFFDRLATYIIENDVSLGFNVKGIILTAEMCSVDQRSRIEKAFGSTVFFEYGHTEISVYCYTKDAGYIYESSPNYGYVEVLDDDGENVSIGDVGRVVVTGFNNYGMPFVRYDTGDVARLATRSAGFVKLGEIFGRSQDFIWSKKKQKVWLTALIFGQHFKAFKNIIKWQLRQDAVGAVAIKIVRGYDYGSIDEREIIEKFQSSADILVSFEYVDAIPTTKAGKHLFLLQNVKI